MNRSVTDYSTVPYGQLFPPRVGGGFYFRAALDSFFLKGLPWGTVSPNAAPSHQAGWGPAP